MEKTLPISVCMITYGHGKYIHDAIESILTQNTNVDYELVISNDACNDETDSIVNHFISTHANGHLIKYIKHEMNLGAMANLIFAVGACSGKYLAMCEGDDYWTNSNKLQIQFDFLESNPDYVLTHHDADYFFQHTGELVKMHHKTNNIIISEGTVYDELLKANNIYTPTVMFRTILFRGFLDIDNEVRNNFLMADYAMWLEFAQHGKFHYNPDSMAVYRVLGNSASKSKLYEKTLAFVNSYFDIRLFFLKKYPLDNVTEEMIEQWRLSMNISTAIKYKRNKEARNFASQLSIYDWRSLLKRITVYMPPLFRYIQRKNKL